MDHDMRALVGRDGKSHRPNIPLSQRRGIATRMLNGADLIHDFFKSLTVMCNASTQGLWRMDDERSKMVVESSCTSKLHLLMPIEIGFIISRQ